MRRAVLDASTDGTTLMLIKLTQALKLSEALPPESGRTLERMARSARLFAEARENAAAANILDQMLDLLPETDTELAEPRAAVQRGVNRVQACLGFTGVIEARRHAELHRAEVA